MKKKVKKYADGGLAGIAQSAQSLMGDVNNMSKRINYGSGDFAGGSTPQLGFLDFQKRQQSLDAGMSDKFSPGPSGVLPGMRIQATDRIGSFKKGGSVKTKKWLLVAKFLQPLSVLMVVLLKAKQRDGLSDACKISISKTIDGRSRP